MQKERKDKNFIKKPVYPGGPTAMRQFIREHLVYPKDALEHRIEGTVTLKYTIDHKGKVIDTHVVAGLGHGCDEEAQRLVRLFRFEVAKSRGVKVTFQKDIHIHFRLPKTTPMPEKTGTQINYVTTSSKAPAAGYSYTITIPNKNSGD